MTQPKMDIMTALGGIGFIHSGRGEEGQYAGCVSCVPGPENEDDKGRVIYVLARDGRQAVFKLSPHADSANPDNDEIGILLAISVKAFQFIEGIEDVGEAFDCYCEVYKQVHSREPAGHGERFEITQILQGSTLEIDMKEAHDTMLDWALEAQKQPINMLEGEELVPIQGELLEEIRSQYMDRADAFRFFTETLSQQERATMMEQMRQALMKPRDAGPATGHDPAPG